MCSWNNLQNSVYISNKDLSMCSWNEQAKDFKITMKQTLKCIRDSYVQDIHQLYRLNYSVYVFLKWTSQRFQDYYDPDSEMYSRFLCTRLRCMNILVPQDVAVSVREHGMCVDPTHDVPFDGQLCVLNLTLIGSWKNNQSRTTSLFYTKWSFSHLKSVGFINNSKSSLWWYGTSVYIN